MKTTIQKEGNVWCWTITQGETVLAGGYCATKRDAENDSGIWIKHNSKITMGRKVRQGMICDVELTWQKNGSCVEREISAWRKIQPEDLIKRA